MTKFEQKNSPISDSLWQEYRSKLLVFVQSRVNNRADAEDIVHNVLVKSYSKQHQLLNRKKFKQWLYQITRNAIIDFYRRHRPTVPLREEQSRTEAEYESADNDMSKCILPFIERLPERYKIAVELTEIEGLSQKEAALRLGLSLSGAKSRVQRGRQQLKSMFDACCLYEFDRYGKIIEHQAKQQCNDC